MAALLKSLGVAPQLRAFSERNFSTYLRPGSRWCASARHAGQKLPTTPASNLFRYTGNRGLTTLRPSPTSLITRPSFFSQNLIRTRFIQPNFFSTAAPLSLAADATASEAVLKPLPSPAVYRWLLGCSVLVFGIVVVGGVTRLTESGLSITEWRPFTGTIPPLTREDWEVEFEKYKLTPEFKMLNHRMTLEEFKSIFWWEYSHRVLGRVLGVIYVLPFAYFVARRKVPTITPALTVFGLLLGFQGFLGWYMVKSGLEESIMHTPGAVPRVSQYRLAAHLMAALTLYVGMLGTAMAARSDWMLAQGTKTLADSTALSNFLATKVGRRFKVGAWGLLALVFTTVASGAFVAGLDAGLVYNEFPLMGGRLVPPTNELFDKAYAKKADGSDTWWRNIFENPTTVQFNHRCLAMTTWASILGATLTSRYYAPLRAVLPPLTKRAITGVFHAANLQVLLGISTLLYLVPIPLAAAHQAGSVVLLSTVVALLATLRRPSALAKAWRAARPAASKLHTPPPSTTTSS